MHDKEIESCILLDGVSRNGYHSPSGVPRWPEGAADSVRLNMTIDEKDMKQKIKFNAALMDRSYINEGMLRPINSFQRFVSWNIEGIALAKLAVLEHYMQLL